MDNKNIKNIRQTMILGILKVTVSDLEALSFSCFVKMPPPIISLYAVLMVGWNFIQK